MDDYQFMNFSSSGDSFSSFPLRNINVLALSSKVDKDKEKMWNLFIKFFYDLQDITSKTKTHKLNVELVGFSLNYSLYLYMPSIWIIGSCFTS